MMTKIKSSWYLRTLTGRLATLCAALIILLALAGGTIYGLVVAVSAEHQSQAVCGLASDVANTPISGVTPPVGKTGLAFIKDARHAYIVGNCGDLHSIAPLPPVAPELEQAYPGIK